MLLLLLLLLLPLLLLLLLLLLQHLLVLYEGSVVGEETTGRGRGHARARSTPCWGSPKPPLVITQVALQESHELPAKNLRLTEFLHSGLDGNPLPIHVPGSKGGVFCVRKAVGGCAAMRILSVFQA